MALQKLQLYKALKFCFLDEKELSRELKKEIRQIHRIDSIGGGDFYSPFWRDAKDHANGKSEITISTSNRIASNQRRSRLFPLYLIGFLSWWNEKRRWINEPIKSEILGLSSKYSIDDLGLELSVTNLMALKIGDDQKRIIYPYFCELPALSGEAARIGLWVMKQAIQNHSINDMRMLDILRGSSFSKDSITLKGDEEEILNSKLATVINMFSILEAEYLNAA